MKEQKGQALVETALIIPLVIFLLIGLFEVGWALRGYLVLANANREAARFAVRPNYLTFTDESYQRVYNQALNSISNQIPFTTTGVILISYVTIEANCYSKTLTITTPIEVPTYTWKYPYTATQTTQFDYYKLGNELGEYQKDYACKISDSGYRPFPNNFVIIEMWYWQKQLFGFPFISNPFTDPVPMYASSFFRKLPDRTDK